MSIMLPAWYKAALIEHQETGVVPASITTEMAAITKNVDHNIEQLELINIGAVCPDCGSDKESNNSGGYFHCPTRGKMIGSPHERNGKSWYADDYKRVVASDLSTGTDRKEILEYAWQ